MLTIFFFFIYIIKMSNLSPNVTGERFGGFVGGDRLSTGKGRAEMTEFQQMCSGERLEFTHVGRIVPPVPFNDPYN